MEGPQEADECRETYPVDPHEMSRLISQDRAFNTLMPKIFSDEQWRSFGTVVDLGCGAGGWCIDMAALHPECQFIGVDSSQEMLEQARFLAWIKNRHNVSFQYMDVRERLRFDDNSVGYVNGRILSLYLAKQSWPPLLQEVYRVLRPGGKIMITDHEALISTSEALERFNVWFLEAAKHHGLFHSPTGRSTGFSAMIRKLLRDAGFGNIQFQVLVQDESFEQPDHDRWIEGVFLMGHTFERFLVAAGMRTNEELQSLLDQIMKDAQDPQFGAVTFFPMAWAEKKSQNHP